MYWPVASSTPKAAAKPTIKIGATNFEEQEIVANLYGDVLTKAGYKVKVEPALGTRAVVVPAIEHGQIDLEPDYAASLLGYLHGGKPQPAGDQISTAIAADKTGAVLLRRSPSCPPRRRSTPTCSPSPRPRRPRTT